MAMSLVVECFEDKTVIAGGRNVKGNEIVADKDFIRVADIDTGFTLDVDNEIIEYAKKDDDVPEDNGEDLASGDTRVDAENELAGGFDDGSNRVE